MNSVLEINSNLMVFQPKLAELLGLNETIIINQMDYWIKKSKNLIEGSYWVFNTYESWQKQLCFFSISTIKNTIERLEAMGIIKSGNFNKSKMDKTKWYTIDYEVLKAFYEEAEDNKINQPIDENIQGSDKNDRSNGVKSTVDEVKSNQAIPEITPETTPKDNKEAEAKAEADFKAVVNFYSENIRLPGSYDLEKLKYLCDEFKDSDLIIFAMEQSVESNARNLRYVEKVLYSWLDKSITTRNTAEAFVKSYKKYKGDGENGGSEGVYRENPCYNSKTSSKDSSKWSGYKPPKPKGSADVSAEGLI